MHRRAAAEGGGRGLLALARWQERAACRGRNVDAFFPEDVADYDTDDYWRAAREAIEVCDACPVQAECAQFALDNRLSWGIWGGVPAAELALWTNKTPLNVWLRLRTGSASETPRSPRDFRAWAKRRGTRVRLARPHGWRLVTGYVASKRALVGDVYLLDVVVRGETLIRTHAGAVYRVLPDPTKVTRRQWWLRDV